MPIQTGEDGVPRALSRFHDLTHVRQTERERFTAQAVRLRGVRPLLTGIQPVVAAALVALAVDFGSLEVFSSLQDAVERATRG
ncbi:MAG TPA: hypothetical protein VGB85_19775 [Nannocystis sp.]